MTVNSHTVYVPYLNEGEAFNRDKSQSSPACLTDGYLEPNGNNLATLIIRNGTHTSDLIKQAIEKTSDWIKYENIAETERTTQEEVVDAKSTIFPVNQEAINAPTNVTSHNGNGRYSHNGNGHYPNNGNSYSPQTTNIPTASENNLDNVPF